MFIIDKSSLRVLVELQDFVEIPGLPSQGCPYLATLNAQRALNLHKRFRDYDLLRPFYVKEYHQRPFSDSDLLRPFYRKIILLFTIMVTWPTKYNDTNFLFVSCLVPCYCVSFALAVGMLVCSAVMERVNE